MSYQLKSIQPKTVLSSYTQGQQVNFDIQQNMDAYENNSVYITFQVKITGVDAVNNTNVFIDPKVGVASFFENFTTECDLFQEVISNYARLQKMLNCNLSSQDLLASGLKNTSELLFGDRSHSNMVIRDMGTNVYGVCHKPNIALNNMIGNLGFLKAGKIKVSYKLPSFQKIFYGSDLGAITPSYSISNIELHYRTVPVGSPSVQIRITEDVQKLIQTSNTTVNNTFINSIDGVLVSFSTTDSETTVSENSLVCQNPMINRMSWVWNDQSNKLVAYEIKTLEEQILSGFSVFDSMESTFDVRDKIAFLSQDSVNDSTDNFIVGLKVGQLMNFSQSGLGLNVRIDNLREQYNVHMYGFGQKQIV